MRTQVSKVDFPAILAEAWQQHLAPRAEDAPTVISTFAGAGGSSLGYSMAGYSELLAVEWDNNAVATFKLNFPDVPVYHGDIAKLTVDEVLETTGLQPGELDVLDGSPPCQGFSTAGKRKFDDDRNQLFREYTRLLRGLQPKVFVMENVSGMVKGKMKLIFADILRELKASGYRVSVRLLNAMYFNVPQSRQRLIFIGVREDLGIEPSHPKAQSRPVSIADALGISTNVGIRENRHSYSAGKCKIATSRFDRPSLTITKARGFSVKRYGDKIAKRDCPDGTITKLSRWFFDKENEFSIEAYAILASFSLEFKFLDSFSSKKARIGNSVPPLFMRAIAGHIRTNIMEAI